MKPFLFLILSWIVTQPVYGQEVSLAAGLNLTDMSASNVSFDNEYAFHGGLLYSMPSDYGPKFKWRTGAILTQRNSSFLSQVLAGILQLYMSIFRSPWSINSPSSSLRSVGCYSVF